MGTVFGFGLLNAATPNPPPRKDQTALSAVATQAESASTAHLDLRLPMIYSSATVEAPASAHSPAPAALHADDLSFRTGSRSAIFVSRVRREGLPFARLWESKSALLSIGLNRNGKPGLWLTQKIR